MIIDILASVLILYGFYTGYKRGLIKTAFSTLSIILAILVTIKLSPIVMDLVESALKLSQSVSVILGIVITFFFVLILIQFIGNRLEGLLKAVNINFINKIGGGLLMAAVFGVCLGFLVQLSNDLRLVSEEQKQTSISYPALVTLPGHARSTLEKFKPMFSEFWDKTVEAIDSAKEKVEEG